MVYSKKKISAAGMLLEILLSVFFWLNPIQQKTNHEKLIEAQNPTDIKIIDINFQQWAIDKDEFLSVTFHNNSSIYADLFNIQLVVKNENKFSQSNTPNFNPNAIMRIKKNDFLKYPLASKIEIIDALGLTSEKKLLGVGITPDISNALMEQFRNDASLININIKGTALFFSYKTIFGQVHKLSTGIYFYIDTTP